MYIIFDIVFQSGEFLNQSSESSLFDLLNTALGAFIGSAATIGAVYLAVKKDREKELNKQAQFQVEKIRYFQSSINSILPKLKTQIALLKIYYEAVNKNPLIIPALEIRTFYELDRMVHKINQEEYYHSYLSQFNNSDATVEEFRKIYSGLDFFEANLKQIKQSLEKSVQFDYERKSDLQRKSENVMDRIAVLLRTANMNNTHPEMLKCLDNLFKEFYSKRKDPSDLKYLYEGFIHNAKVCLLSEESTFPEIHSILIDLKNCTHIYSDIQQQNLYMSNDFKEYHDTLLKVLGSWEGVIKRLSEYQQ